MSAALRKMESAGFELRRNGDRLEIAPADRLSPEQRAYLVAHKAELIAALELPANEQRIAALMALGWNRANAEFLAHPVNPEPEPEPEQSAALAWVTCASCVHSHVAPTTDPVYGWRRCGLELERGGGFGQALRRCESWIGGSAAQ